MTVTVPSPLSVISYLGTLLIADDEVVFCRVRADARDEVEQASVRAGLRHDRILEDKEWSRPAVDHKQAFVSQLQPNPGTSGERCSVDEAGLQVHHYDRTRHAMSKARRREI